MKWSGRPQTEYYEAIKQSPPDFSDVRGRLNVFSFYPSFRLGRGGEEGVESGEGDLTRREKGARIHRRIYSYDTKCGLLGERRFVELLLGGVSSRA